MEDAVERVPADVQLASYLAYNALFVPTASALIRLAAPFNAKLKRGLKERAHVWSRLETSASTLQGCVWVHAASAGEVEQARPLLRALRARYPETATLLTVFSPSGYDHAVSRAECDHVEYLPYDTPGATRRMIDLLKPRALVFISFDCWPNLVWAARRANVPAVLLNANFHRRSGRLRPGVSGFYRGVFDCLSTIGCIADDDRSRFANDLGVRTPITVTGDMRVDQVVHRHEQNAQAPSQLAATATSYIALGSIWPQDEAVVLEPALEAVTTRPDWGIVAAPHEPHASALERLEHAFDQRGLPHVRLSRFMGNSSDARNIVIDSVGVLAEVYRATSITYVGGGFSSGVHNVIEPAVTGQPILFGPRNHNAHEAARLVERGAAYELANAASARKHLARLMDDEPARRHSGDAARAYVLEQRGAGSHNQALLDRYLG